MKNNRVLMSAGVSLLVVSLIAGCGGKTNETTNQGASPATNTTKTESQSVSAAPEKPVDLDAMSTG